MVDELAELTERQRVILEYVVEDYLAGGHPVGSKALTARRRMRVSASTVRYELAELEERGFLTHPHTSAGRVPTDQGYRFYVDRLLGSLAPKPTDLPLDLSGVRNEIDAALQTTIDALTQVTHLLALATAPPLETTVVRHVEVLLLQPQVVVVVIITSTGGVTKRLFVFDEPVDPGLADWAARVPERDRSPGCTSAPACCGTASTIRPSPGREREFLAVLEPAFTELVGAGRPAGVRGGRRGLIDELRAEDITTFRACSRRSSDAPCSSTCSASRSTPSDRSCASAPSSPIRRSRSSRSSRRPYGLSNRNLGTVSLLGPSAHGLRQGDRRGPLGGRTSCRASSRSSTTE